MAFRGVKWTEEKIQERLRKGYGQGTGASYVPFISELDLDSKRGTRYRIACGRTGRICSLLSSVEYRAYLCFDACPRVTDIREHFPLDRELTRRLASQAGIPHPRMDGIEIVMTTDLLVSFVNAKGNEAHVAVSCQDQASLGQYKEVEYAEIERRFHRSNGIPFGFVTNESDCISDQAFANLELMQVSRRMQHEHFPFDGYFERRCAMFLEQLLAFNERATLLDFINDFSGRHGQSADGEVSAMALHLIWKGRILANLDACNLLEQCVGDLAANTRLGRHSLPSVVWRAA